MTIALLAILYVAFGQWIAIRIGRETDGYTIAACGMARLPLAIWGALRMLRAKMAASV